MRERIESGLSVRAYCKSAGFHENTYYYWQKRLRETACAELAGRVQPSVAAHPGFTEVQLSKPVGYTANTASETQGRIRISAAGIEISADGGYPAENLSALLREVLRPC